MGLAILRMYLLIGAPLLSLAIIYILKLKPGEGYAHFGIKCSSMCSMYRGTSGRSVCASLGYLLHASVAYSNKLLERTLNCFGSTCVPQALRNEAHKYPLKI